MLAEIDDHFDDNYLNEETILKLARAKGYGTAGDRQARADTGFSITPRAPAHTRSFSTTRPARRRACRYPKTSRRRSPPRACRSRRQDAATMASAGDAKTPGTTVANIEQQNYFADVAAKVVLPMLKARNKPFVMVYWSRDPDGIAAQSGRQPSQAGARHQRADRARGHSKRRQQPQAPARHADRTRPRRHDQHHDCGRPRLLDHLQGKQDQPGGEGGLQGRSEGPAAAQASSRSILPRRSGCRCSRHSPRESASTTAPFRAAEAG